MSSHPQQRRQVQSDPSPHTEALVLRCGPLPRHTRHTEWISQACHCHSKAQCCGDSQTLQCPTVVQVLITLTSTSSYTIRKPKSFIIFLLIRKGPKQASQRLKIHPKTKPTSCGEVAGKRPGVEGLAWLGTTSKNHRDTTRDKHPRETIGGKEHFLWLHWFQT